MQNYILSYLVTLFSFVIVDGIWLGLVARNFYSKHLGYIMADPINWTAAVFFYLLYILGILYFVVYPALEHQNLTKLLISAAFFGFITYATYDLTNFATIRDWPLIVVIVDIAWGTLLGLLVGTSSYYLIRYFGIV